MSVIDTVQSPKFPMSFVIVDGLQVRYTRAPNPGQPTVVLLSPWPESIYAWWPAWRFLTKKFDVIAVDLPGFGQSEGRPGLMGPSAMGAFIPKILSALGTIRPHVVGPDIGTGALLFTAARHPETVASIVIGGGAASFPLRALGILAQFIEAPSVVPFRQLDPAEIAAGAVRSIAGYTPPEFVVEDYVASYSGFRFMDSIAYVRSYPVDLAELAPHLPDIDVPVLILASKNDPLLELSDPENLNRMIRTSQLQVLDNFHNAWEESPEIYAHHISTWVTKHSRE